LLEIDHPKGEGKLYLFVNTLKGISQELRAETDLAMIVARLCCLKAIDENLFAKEFEVMDRLLKTFPEPPRMGGANIANGYAPKPLFFSVSFLPSSHPDMKKLNRDTE
jgi:hypothetical protein